MGAAVAPWKAAAAAYKKSFNGEGGGSQGKDIQVEQWWHQHSLHVREKCFMTRTLWVISKTAISYPDAHAQ